MNVSSSDLSPVVAEARPSSMCCHPIRFWEFFTSMEKAGRSLLFEFHWKC
jgi:hypothetical protein